jgi:FkbM family methyltransferase
MNRLGKRIFRPWWVHRLRKKLDVGKPEVVRLGTAHGGWTVPAATIQSKGTAVCVGAGEDISFDVELNKRGFNVLTVDPTPRAKAHVARVLDAAKGGQPVAINNSSTDFYDLEGFSEARFKFIDVGVWNENTSMRFFAPKSPKHVSHSIVNLQGTNEWFEAKCETLQTICNSHKITQIDILKLDVEGSEYIVLENVVQSGLLPRVLCVDFDEIWNPIDSALMERILATIDLLANSAYKFQHVDNSNSLFVRETSNIRSQHGSSRNGVNLIANSGGIVPHMDAAHIC